MYIPKHFSYNFHEIHKIIKVVSGVNYSVDQIKIIPSLSHSGSYAVDFVCSHSSTTTIIKLEEFLECQGLSRSYSNVKAIYNKPWWNPIGRKIVGFSLDAKIDFN
jgi:hypothetical protein